MRVLALVVVLLHGCSLRHSGWGGASSEVVATYGERALTRGEAQRMIARLPPPARAALVPLGPRRAFVENLVLSRLLYEEGRALGYADDPAVRGQPMAVREGLVVQMVIAAYRTPTPVSDDEVRRYYDANAKHAVRKGKAPPYASVKEKLRILLSDQRGEDRLRAHLARIREHTALSIHDDALARIDPVAGLKPAPAPPSSTGH